MAYSNFKCKFKPKPYEVFTLQHEDFMDYKTLQMNTFPKLSKVDDGTKIKMRDIKSFIY